MATYDAIWAFKEDILELRGSLREKFVAHLSQPLGLPLHMYRGRITVLEDKIVLSGWNKRSGEPFELSIDREMIENVHMGWDRVLRRWRDTRAWIRPLRITFRERGRKRTLYVYAKKPEGAIYGRENGRLYEYIKIGSP
jgi:hypothetical protein